MGSEDPDIDNSGFLSDIRSLDERINALDLNIWVGGEPTFTDRYSEAPEWLDNALGGDKEQRAERMLRHFIHAFPGCAVLRTLGRQYPGEAMPRWSLGLYARRNGEPAWLGPPDPMLATTPCGNWSPEGVVRSLESAAGARGWSCLRIESPKFPRHRLLVRMDGAECIPDQLPEHLLHRSSVHDERIPDAGLRDELSESGHYLIGCDRMADRTGGWPVVELPQVPAAKKYLEILSAVSDASLGAGLTGIRLAGFPPPMDRHVQWTSLTPDPAVIEANLAPAVNIEEFFALSRRLFGAAEMEYFSPFRLQYNGRQSDSGGGGQITVGGPTPEASPFFLKPQLLPRLVRYFNRHPSLSYWFATDYIGSGSQAPRCDEGLRERFPELNLALEQIGKRTFPDPEFIWSSLAPFLADAGGNSHRSEINIEKLWNPYLGDRGRQGLVELRPFRMQPSIEKFTALALLVRALVARLMQYPYDAPLVDWGDRLHARFALPFYLKQDLRAVLEDLDATGLGVGDAPADLLLDDSEWAMGRLDWQGISVRVSRALEFWPLIGDRTSQYPADSRLVDASTARFEILLYAPDPALFSGIDLHVNGYRAALHMVGAAPSTRLTGIRYRSFVPWKGLHPALPAHDRIKLMLSNRSSMRVLHITLYEWRPDGEPYTGLPKDFSEAARRRSERLVAREADRAESVLAPHTPEAALSDYCFDLRRI